MPDFVIPGIYFDIANFSTDEFKGSGIRYSMGLAARLNTPMGIINLAYGIKTEAIGKTATETLVFYESALITEAKLVVSASKCEFDSKLHALFK